MFEVRVDGLCSDIHVNDLRYQYNHAKCSLCFSYPKSYLMLIVTCSSVM